MGRYFRNARFAIVFLLIFLVGRLAMGFFKVPYSEGTRVFTLVTFAVFASIVYGGFSRRLWGFTWLQAILMGATIGLSAQIIIFLTTIVSYLVGAHTYFNNPLALNQTTETAVVTFGQAMGIRVFGLVINLILDSIAALVGWAFGKLIPEKQ